MLLRIDIIKRDIYWNSNYPAGIADIPARDMIDIDEAGIFLETVARKIGKAFIGSRVREEGPYGHSEKYTLTMAISGDQNGERWVDFARKAGTTAIDFYDYIMTIINDIGPGTAVRRRCFTFDNLTAHHNPAVVWAILAAGHRIAFRAPYYPVDGAIEYVFNSIQQQLTYRMHEITDYAELEQAVQDIIGGMVDFRNYFFNVGFTL